MKWFEKKKNPETENPEVKPRIQILQTPESVTSEAKGKLDSPEKNKRNAFIDRIKVPETSSEKGKLSKHEGDGNASGTTTEGSPVKGQRQLERGHETEQER